MSEGFHDYSALFAPDTGNSDEPLLPTPEYLLREEMEASKCAEMFDTIRKYEAAHDANWLVRWSSPRQPKQPVEHLARGATWRAATCGNLVIVAITH